MQATWTRLADGTWGIRVEVAFGPLLEAMIGQEVDVTRSDGNVSSQKVIELVKYIAPRPAKRVRGRTLQAIEKPLAIFKVEERSKAPFARKASKPRAQRPRWNTAEYDIQHDPKVTATSIAAELDAAGPLLTPAEYYGSAEDRAERQADWASDVEWAC